MSKGLSERALAERHGKKVLLPSSLLLWLSLGALGLIVAGFRHNWGEMPLFFVQPGIFFRRLDRLGGFGVK